MCRIFSSRGKKTNQYILPKEHTGESHSQHYSNESKNTIHQPLVYETALFLAERMSCRYIIVIGCDDVERLKIFSPKYRVIVIDYATNKDLLKKSVKGITLIRRNLEKGLPYLPRNILSSAVVVVSDVFEHMINPTILLKDLAKLARKACFTIVSTPDRERIAENRNSKIKKIARLHSWNSSEFIEMLKNSGFPDFISGHTIDTLTSNSRNILFALTGPSMCRVSTNNTRVLAIINCYNEEDIIREVIESYLSQGIDVYITDNWSTDCSLEIIEECAVAYPGKVLFEVFPEKRDDFYDWTGLLDHTVEVARQSSYDWIIHSDSDEIRESPWPDISLFDAISLVDNQGYNAIDFTVLDFRPTKNGYYIFGESVQESMRYFEFGKREGHFLQIKAWKNEPRKEYNLSDTGGHAIEFEGRKVYPLKFILRHFPLRNQEQAERKIFVDRKPRFEKENAEKGWHTQYDQFDEGYSFLWNFEELMLWQANESRDEYAIELISGVGIRDSLFCEE